MTKNGSSQDSTTPDRIDSIKDSLKGLVDRGEERAHTIKTRVIEVKDQAMTRGNQYVDRTTDLIKANPLKSVAIAFGVGYIGMRLFRR